MPLSDFLGVLIGFSHGTQIWLTPLLLCWLSFHPSGMILFFLIFITNWWRMQSQKCMKCNDTALSSHINRKSTLLQHVYVSIIPVCQHSLSPVCQHATLEERTRLVIYTSKITRPLLIFCVRMVYFRHTFFTNIPGKCHMALNKLIVQDRQEQTQPLGVAGFKQPSVT